MELRAKTPRRVRICSIMLLASLALIAPWSPPVQGGQEGLPSHQAARDRSAVVDASVWFPAGWHNSTTAISERAPAAHTPLVSITVSGTVAFDTGGPVEGALVTGSTRAAHQGFLPLIIGQGGGARSAVPNPVGPQILPPNQAITDANGHFSLSVAGETPIRVLVEVSFDPAGLPSVRTARWRMAEGSSLDVGTLLIPNPQGAEIPLQYGSGESADGSVGVTGMPADVDRLFARAYDPDEQADAFPGEFAENGAIPLDSAVFLWMEAQDSAGNPVDNLSQAAIIRARVPASQWLDLEDIDAGTCCIELPLYAYDETGNLWQQEGTGWLEDTDGRALPEDAQALLLDGSYGGDVYAVFRADHLSFYNVDYPFIGPWTLSRLSREQRNSDCLYRALRAAEAIWNTRWASQAYSDVNKPGADFDLSEEVPPGEGPEILAPTAEDIEGAWGEVREEDFAENIHLSADLWQSCDSYPDKTALVMLDTILHEMAHWKHIVKKNDGDYTATEDDVGGEAGYWVEDSLLGGEIDTWNGDLPIDESDLLIRRTLENGDGESANIIPDQIEDLLDPEWWFENDGRFDHDFWEDFWRFNWEPGAGAGAVGREPEQAGPVDIGLGMDNSYIELGQPVIVDVEFHNASADPVNVLGLTVLQSHPLFFQVLDSNGVPVPFVGPRIKYGTGPQDYVELASGETLERSVDLMRDADRDTRHFGFLRGGTYEVQATYTRWHGLPETESNTVTFTLGNGGSLSGNVSSAASGGPIEGAVVEAILDGELWSATTSGGSGYYEFPELPPGGYALTATALGYRHQALVDITIVKDELTVAGFHLLPMQWTRTTVDSDGSVGAASSVAVDQDGWAHIAYSDFTGPALKYARQDASGWHIEVVDGGTDGMFNSLALDANGYAHIGYYSGPSGLADLTYAYQDAAGWNEETVDTTVRSFCSLALDEAGNAHISYCGGQGSGRLRHAFRDAGWQIETVDNEIADCADSSIAMDGEGHAHIAYYDDNLHQVRYAYQDATGWHTQLVSDNGAGGVSLALDRNGRPHITYHDFYLSAVRHALLDETGWRLDTVAETGLSFGNVSSLRLDSRDLPYVAYFELDPVEDYLLKLAYHDGLSWHVETWDPDPTFTPWRISLALDSAGWPHISYFDLLNGNLMYAR